MRFRLKGCKEFRKNGLKGKLYSNLNLRELKNWKNKEIKYLKNIKKVCLEAPKSKMIFNKEEEECQSLMQKAFSMQQLSLSSLTGLQTIFH
jgi:hypothetical protein